MDNTLFFQKSPVPSTLVTSRRHRRAQVQTPPTHRKHANHAPTIASSVGKRARLEQSVTIKPPKAQSLAHTVQHSRIGSRRGSKDNDEDRARVVALSRFVILWDSLAVLWADFGADFYFATHLEISKEKLCHWTTLEDESARLEAKAARLSTFW